MLKVIFTIGFLIFGQISLADPFIVVENKLIYDTENSEEATEIAFGHEEELLKILRTHTDIDTLVLNSGGGMIGAANDMADLIIDADIKTYVEGTCGSARCLYENEDILVEHRISIYSDGERSATMLVHLKKDVLLWRTETGVTPLPPKE